MGFVGEVTACFGEDVSGAVHDANPTPTRHSCWGVVRRNTNARHGNYFLGGCCLSSRVIHTESLKVTINGCAFCFGETDL